MKHGLILASASDDLWYVPLNSQYNILISIRRQLARLYPPLFILPRISFQSCLITATQGEIISVPRQTYLFYWAWTVIILELWNYGARAKTWSRSYQPRNTRQVAWRRWGFLRSMVYCDARILDQICRGITRTQWSMRIWMSGFYFYWISIEVSSTAWKCSALHY